MKLKYIVIVGLFLTSFAGSSQEDIKGLIFEFKSLNSLRRPGIKNLKISITKTAVDVVIDISIDKTVYDELYLIQWMNNLDFTNAKNKEDSLIVYKNKQYQPRNIIYQKTKLAPDEFEKVKDAVKKIDFKKIKDFSEGSAVCGGVSCTIQYERNGKSIKHSVWSPDESSKKRGTVDFLVACKLILKCADVKHRKIFN